MRSAHEALQRELDERFAEAMAQHRRRQELTAMERAQKARARKYGLQRRHAQKLEKTGQTPTEHSTGHP